MLARAGQGPCKIAAPALGSLPDGNPSCSSQCLLTSRYSPRLSLPYATRDRSHHFHSGGRLYMTARRVCSWLYMLLFSSALCAAQSALLNIPRQSQGATVSQRVGITDITVKYHRPLVNNRQIFGKVVPYGQVWRAGANENTLITFTDPVTIEGQSLDRGTYGLHMIPNADQWTVIFNKTNTAWGSFSYDQKEDALRVNVKPQPVELHEALTYDFDEVKPDSTVLTLKWEKVAVPVKIGVNVHEIAKASLDKQLRGIQQYTW